MITRTDIHAIIDKQLDDWGVQEALSVQWGSISFNLTIERGMLKLVAKERETQKEITVSSKTAG